MNKNNIGSTFDSWLREEGIYDEASSAAIKRVLTRQVEAAMAEQNISKAEMAKRMQTSRAALNRLLDPSHDAVALSTLQKAAIALGRQIRLELGLSPAVRHESRHSCLSGSKSAGQYVLGLAESQ